MVSLDHKLSISHKDDTTTKNGLILGYMKRKHKKLSADLLCTTMHISEVLSLILDPGKYKVKVPADSGSHKGPPPGL